MSSVSQLVGFPSSAAIALCTLAKRTWCPSAAAQRGWGLLRCGHGVTGRGEGPACFREGQEHINDAYLIIDYLWFPNALIT